MVEGPHQKAESPQSPLMVVDAPHQKSFMPQSRLLCSRTKVAQPTRPRGCFSDSASDTETATSVTTFQAGDSVFGDESHVDAEGAGGQKDAAVAMETKGSERKPRNITPAQHDITSEWEARHNADHVGNIG